jgi:hypothetical protein
LLDVFRSDVGHPCLSANSARQEYLPKEIKVTLQDNLNSQQDFDLFSIFTGERIDPARPAVMEASTHALYQTRSIVMVSDEVVEEALASDATSKRIMSKGLAPAVGDIVGIRLNLNLIKSKGVPVQTVHAGKRSDGYTRNKGLYNGSAIAYHKVVTLEKAYFNVSQKGREDVASGAVSKFPLASVDGAFMDTVPDFSGLEISFNPKRVRLFCDSENRPIRFAEQATIYGNRIYVRGRVEYYTMDTAPAKGGNSPCSIVF